MLRRVIVAAIVALVLLAAVTAAAEPASRLVVLGDVHGDLDQLQAALLMARVVTKESGFAWTAGADTTLVQVGDLIDRGAQDKAVLDYVRRLRAEAEAAGATVVNLLGNHELMNMQGHIHYVHADALAAYGGQEDHRSAFARHGEYGEWLRKDFVTAYHDREFRTLFVHAGLHPKYVRALKESHPEEDVVAVLNDKVREQLNLPLINERHPLLATEGPLWTRLLVKEAESGRCGNVRQTLKLVGADRMVVGHTPQRDGRPGLLCDGDLLVVDVGMSKWMYGHLAAVQLERDNATGEVTLHEIVPQQYEPPLPDEDDDGEDTMDTALKRDPHILQEMLDTVREMGAPVAGVDAKAQADGNAEKGDL